MGWLISYSSSYQISDMLIKLRRPDRFGETYELLMSRVVGNHHWYLVEEKSTGHQIIGLDLMKGPSKRLAHGAGYKDMSELDGPYAYDCPLSLIDNARAPENERAYEWRMQVRKWHASRAVRKAALTPGSILQYGGTNYRLERSLGRKGWNVARVEDGHPFRMKVHQVSAAALLSQQSMAQS